MVKVRRKPSGTRNTDHVFACPPSSSVKTRPSIFSDFGLDPDRREKVHSTPVKKESATWVIRKNDEVKYKTENTEKFNDPKSMRMQPVVKNEGFETSRDKMRVRATEKFIKLAKSRYGGAEDLFKAFQKMDSDNIRLDEFSELLRKRSLDLYFPRDEQRLFFEQFDGSFSSAIGVGDVIKYYEKHAPSIHITARISEQQKMERNGKVLAKIFNQRENQKLLNSPRQTTLQLVRSLRNLDPNSTGYISKDELRWGLGKDYMNIPLTSDEINAIVDLCPPEAHNGLISYDKFARMLEIKNDDPVIEPFFDARANQVTRLKQRVQHFDKVLMDDKLNARRQELMDKFHSDTGGTFNLNPTGSLSTLNKTVSCPELTLSNSPMRQSPRYTNATPVIETEEETHTSLHNQDFLTSKKQRGKGGNQHQNSVDLTDTVHSPTIAGLMPGGKRLFNHGRFDETLLQHNMGVNTAEHSQDFRDEDHPGTPSYNNYMSRSSTMDDERFNTTSSSYFAPLLYRPSVPVIRPSVMGDSMKCALKRENRRKKRYERTAKNLQSFADAKELDELSTLMNEQLRCKGRALESLQYESSAIHNDIKKFSKQQVMSMQRKPNKVLYDKMWGGDKEQSRKSVKPTEDRDFSTTYSGSFVLSSTVADRHRHQYDE